MRAPELKWLDARRSDPRSVRLLAAGEAEKHPSRNG
jgi:hypothetical protein